VHTFTCTRSEPARVRQRERKIASARARGWDTGEGIRTLEKGVVYNAKRRPATERERESAAVPAIDL
jgi:hypothetical protein